MAFDLCDHKIKTIMIKFGQLLFPEERDVTKLYHKAAEAIGMDIIKTTSSMADHPPTPEESAKENPELAQICPKCGEKSYILRGLCSGCKDAENGKYKTMFECYKCHHKVKSEEHMVAWLKRLGIEFGTQTKKSLGIKTMTDGGLK